MKQYVTMEKVIEVVLRTYQIFINQKGTDMKLNLANIIYDHHTKCVFNVFLDKEEILVGDSLCLAICGPFTVPPSIFSFFMRSTWNHVGVYRICIGR